MASEEPVTPALIDGLTLFRALQAGSASLQAHVAEVNALNVFPVPDGDTGTNMSLTLRAALDEVASPERMGAAETFRAIAHGALMGARGNSGVILSQILRGFARALDDKAHVDGADIANGLAQGAETAYKGVMKPVEGTMLTVIREAAEAAHGAAAVGAQADAVLAVALVEARASLQRTPGLLPVLAEAGVVDAGGQGLVRILEGIVAFARGEPVSEQPPAVAGEMAHVHDHPLEEYGFDVQFIVAGERLDVEAMRAHLATMGDSLLVVGDDKTAKVHIHSEHPGPILEYGIAQGTLSTVIIENMQLQYQQFLEASQAAAPAVTASPAVPADRIRASIGGRPLSDVSVVAVASGPGLSQVFESLGAEAVVSGGQTMNPSTQDLVTAIAGVSNEQVLVLPNNSNIILTARQASEIAQKTVRVVPTRTMPQGISALLGFSFQAGLDENYDAMLASSQQVDTLEITRAVRSVQVNGMQVEEGQFIGLWNDDLRAAGTDPLDVVKATFDGIDMSAYEIITIYHGQDVAPAEAETLSEALRALYPDIEYEVLDGGQAHYHYIISAE